MNKEEIIKSLNKVYENSKDSHNIYTPLELCEEMINSLSDLIDNKSILVISNLEFLIVLKSKINLENVHYTTSCDIKKQVAISLGLNVNNIYNLEYNKEISLGIEENMKFDYIIQNPPYNPNSLWKKFVEKGIDLLNTDGQMIAIHPDSWRISANNDKFCQHLKEHISLLNITEFNSFPGVGTSTDWYLYHKIKQNKCKVTYANGDIELLDLKSVQNILRFSNKSIPYNILQKICTKNNNGLIQQGRTGYHPLYKKHDPIKGIYKQCGTEGRGTNWTTDDFSLTVEPNENQFKNKVVMSYTRRPRAKFFCDTDAIGAVRVDYWLTDNKSLPILLNSNIVWKLGIELTTQEINRKTHSVLSFPYWFLQSLNFDNLNVQTEEELYSHYNLTQDEISWIKKD